jgi:hypothetical protein
MVTEGTAARGAQAVGVHQMTDPMGGNLQGVRRQVDTCMPTPSGFSGPRWPAEEYIRWL